MGGIPSFQQPLRFAFLISVSLAASYTTTTSALFFPIPKPDPNQPQFRTCSQPPATSVPKATARDLLTLLGPPNQASSVNQQESTQLKSCFKFLVPFSPDTKTLPEVFKPARRALNSVKFLINNNTKEAKDNELIWWPPEPVLELARLAIDSGGDPGVIHRALDPTVIQVPDVEGSKGRKCELTRTPYGRRFINEDLNAYLKFLFRIIEARGPSIGLNVALNRYDFFHGHLFIAVDSGRLGILFHAKEYPAYDKDVFPYNMGYCQKGSNVAYDNSMNLRNILWLAPLPSNSTKTWLAPGVLVVLDARPDGIIYKDLIPEYVNFVRTIYEDDFGEVVLDVNFLNVGTEVSRYYELFLC